jgi:site-specific recombinase XerD
VTIERAVKAFLAELHETAAFATHKKYRLLLNQVRRVFREARLRDDRPVGAVRRARVPNLMGVSPQTGRPRMSMLKPFFEYCVSNEWITATRRGW